MANDGVSATKTKLRIGTQAEDPSGDTFETIGDLIEATGSWGIEWSENEFPRLDGEMGYSKASKSFGEVEARLHISDTNQGRDDAETAADDSTSTPYNVQIELNNSKGSNGTTYDFKALVMSFTTAAGDVNSEITHSIRFRIVEAPVKTAAA
jgi:hypothetical protein